MLGQLLRLAPPAGSGPFSPRCQAFWQRRHKTPEHWTVTSEMMKFPMPGTWVPSSSMGCSCRGLQDLWAQ